MTELNFHDMFPPDPNKETVTEEMHPEKKWFDEAKKMTMDELPDFMDRMTHGYNHDYGTAIHAVSACALAAAWAACREDDTGLTGFQAGFVMWDFIRNWTKIGNKCGLRIIDYDDLLYPQYEYKMDNTISKVNWEALQKEAKKNLETKLDAHPYVIAHWKSIVEGNVPFGYKVLDDQEEIKMVLPSELQNWMPLIGFVLVILIIMIVIWREN